MRLWSKSAVNVSIEIVMVTVYSGITMDLKTETVVNVNRDICSVVTIYTNRDVVTCHREIVVRSNSSLCFRHPLSVSTVTMSQRDCCKEQQFPVFQTSSVSVHCKHVTERLL